MLDFVKLHRDGEEIPVSHLRTAIYSFGRKMLSNIYHIRTLLNGQCVVELNRRTDKPLLLYITEFEKPYIFHTKRYYEAESSLAISELDISNFMQKVGTNWHDILRVLMVDLGRKAIGGGKGTLLSILRLFLAREGTAEDKGEFTS